VISEPEGLRALVRRQLAKYEADPQHPYSLESLPPDLVERELRGIVGFRIAISRIEANAKLSQNRSGEDHRNVVAELDHRGDAGSRGVAELMRRRRPGPR
jgi:transcriptional regulator